MTNDSGLSQTGYEEKHDIHRLVTAVIIKNGKNEICLIKEKRIRKGREVIRWSIPGGLIKENERIIDCAVREVKEETNLTVEVEQLLGIIDWSKSRSDKLAGHSGHFGVDFIFGAIYVDGQAIPQQEEGITEVKFFDFNDIAGLDLNSAFYQAIQRFLDNGGIPLKQLKRNIADYSYLAEFT